MEVNRKGAALADLVAKKRRPLWSTTGPQTMQVIKEMGEVQPPTEVSIKLQTRDRNLLATTIRFKPPKT